ncbi:MAG: M50 family metallopeptidase [Planctomycetes bacterium]|nr:M50 family metallopeptidase [Planctomycetota bacterium]
MNMLDNAPASHRIGRIIGIEVRIIYLLYITQGLYLLYSLGRAQTFIHGLTIFLVLMAYPFCIFLHEMGHSLAALKEGLRVGRIYLHPLGGLAMIEGMIPGPFSEIFIALAGPFVSLLLAAFAFVPLLLFSSGSPLGYHGNFVLDLCVGLFFVNIIPALFNLLPIFPLDGGRVAMAISVLVAGPEKAIPAMAKVTKVCLVLLAAAGVLVAVNGNIYQGVMLIGIAVMVYFMGKQELQARMYAAQYTGGGGFNIYSMQQQQVQPWESPEWHPEKGFAKPEEKKQGWFARWQEKRSAEKSRREQEAKEELNRNVDEILAKVKRDGIGSLSPKEKDILNRASAEQRKKS